MTMTTVAPTANHGKRWLGVLLSLFVPGFGLVRAGKTMRGLLWFVGLQIAVASAFAFACWRDLPTWAFVAGFDLVAAGYLAMLIDSFRPGTLGAGRYLPPFIVAVLALVVVRTFPSPIAQSFVMPNASMEPTLRGPGHGTPDQFIVDRVTYLFSSPQRGDLAAVQTPLRERDGATSFQARRVVGLPGETIEIRDGTVYANDRPLGEADGLPKVVYSQYPLALDASKTGIYQVPPDAYFVLGDTPGFCLDSRHYGPLPRTAVYGRVARIYYPFSRLGIPR